jgi:hypothetical protein
MVRSGVAGAFLLLPAAPAAAERIPSTAAEALDIQYQLVQQAMRTAPCKRSEAGEEIVVCGRRYGPPDEFPDPPGERVRLQSGEANSGSHALAQTAGSSCTTVGANPRCGGGVDVIRGARVLGKIGRHLLGRDD